MLLPQAKERERYFKLALRMGLPIFFFTVALTFVSITHYFETIPVSFFVTAIGILAVMVYFLFYLIYRSVDERITDPITRTFTREYLETLFEKEVKKGPYTIMLMTVENLHDINQRYGPKNGDRVLVEFSQWIGKFLEEKGIQKFPIGHYRGGDFLIGLPGEKIKYKSLLDLMCMKAENYEIDEMEIGISSAIIDTAVSKDVDRLITRLFELQQEKKAEKEAQAEEEEEEYDPTELEVSIMHAIRERSFSIKYQSVVENAGRRMLESTIKLIGNNGKLIHQRSYIPVINRMGLSREFDMLMLESVVEQCRHFDDGTMIALTLFPSTVRNHAFFEKVQILFANNEAARGRVVFVLGEREYYSRISRYDELLQSYRRMGILIALDRLGVYQTTLLYLKELDVDIVRFDSSFGKNIKDNGYQALIRGLTTSAQCLGVKTWIKMIENEEQKAIAESVGIDYMQGNFFGKIASIEDLEETE